jgi:integrase/recombinase XerD
MLEFYVELDFKRRQLRECPVGQYVDRFANWLRSAGYKRRPGQLALRGAAHVGYWTSARSVPTDQIDDGVLTSFARHLPTCACAHPFHGGDRYHREGAQRFVEHLQDVGIVPPRTVRPEIVPPVATRFSRWLRRHRGVTESTVALYVPLVQEFLGALGDDAAGYDAAGVRAFIFARAGQHGHSRAKSVINAVRMFLRFLAVYGHCPAALVGAVPRIAEWKLSSLPRYIAADDIERLVAVCDSATGVGARDRAVILLLARLGLRAGDVRDLRLGDIDWAHGRFRVIGKSRSATWLPLPQEVGDAVGLEFLVTQPLGAARAPDSERPNARCRVRHEPRDVRWRSLPACGPPTMRGSAPNCSRP